MIVLLRDIFNFLKVRRCVGESRWNVFALQCREIFWKMLNHDFMEYGPGSMWTFFRRVGQSMLRPAACSRFSVLWHGPKSLFLGYIIVDGGELMSRADVVSCGCGRKRLRHKRREAHDCKRTAESTGPPTSSRRRRASLASTGEIWSLILTGWLPRTRWNAGSREEELWPKISLYSQRVGGTMGRLVGGPIFLDDRIIDQDDAGLQIEAESWWLSHVVAGSSIRSYLQLHRHLTQPRWSVCQSPLISRQRTDLSSKHISFFSNSLPSS